MCKKKSGQICHTVTADIATIENKLDEANTDDKENLGL